MNYKAPDNSIHVLDDDSFAYLLPEGSIAITDEEAEELRPKPPPPTVQDHLNALDAANALTQRNLRDFIIRTTEALKLGLPVDLTQIPMVANVAAVEAEAAALRAQL
jgi:hypothetical protein